MRKFLFALPLGILLIVGSIFMISLGKPEEPFSSVLINHPVPAFTLQAIEYEGERGESKIDLPPGLSNQDLTGKVSLVNVFASWCVSCRIEHPLLMEVSKRNQIPVMGLNWKDAPGDGAAWLTRFGNPYTRIGDDQNGRAAIDFGVTGAPETFVIDHTGRIRYKHQGPITISDWNTKLTPMIRKLQLEASQ